MSAKRVVILLALVSGLLAGCGVKAQPELSQSQPPAVSSELAPVKLAAGAKLKVVATTNIVGDLLKNVGGDGIDLTVMLPIGADPHSFQPAPRDVAAVSNADVVFINGLGLERFLTSLIENSNTQVTLVSLAEGIEPLDMTGHDDHAGESESADVHDHGGVDPHIWLSPVNVGVMAGNAARALAQLDPANAPMYQANAAAYQQQLTELDRWIKEQVGQIPPAQRKLVTDHDTFGYFAERYGFQLVGTVIPSFSTNAEPSAQELADLQQAVEKNSVKAVFVGTTVNPVLSSRLADDTGIKLVRLYTGSLGDAASGAATYLDYMRYNTSAIVEALK